MEAPDPEGRGVEVNDASRTSTSTSTSSSAMSSSRLLSLSSVASEDPVTREWEELPFRALIKEIFGTISRRQGQPFCDRAAVAPEVNNMASRGKPLSFRQKIYKWVWWTRWRFQHRSNMQQQQKTPHKQEAQQLPPAPSSMPTPEFYDNVISRSYSPEPFQQANEEFRGDAMGKLVEKVHWDLEAMDQAKEDEINAVLPLQPQLVAREEEIESALKAFQEEKEGREMKLRGILENSDKLEEWGIRQNGNCWTQDGGDVDVDTVFMPQDGLSAKIIRCRAAYLAVDDVIESLEKAVQQKALPFGLYLEKVQSLTATQFFHSASMEMLKAVQKLLGREAEMDDEMGTDA